MIRNPIDVGALIIRIRDFIVRIRNPQSGIGNYLGAYTNFESDELSGVQRLLSQGFVKDVKGFQSDIGCQSASG